MDILLFCQTWFTCYYSGKYLRTGIIEKNPHGEYFDIYGTVIIN